MALTASRTDLTISLVGEDETQQMLEDAKARMSGLESRLKNLKAAGDQQAQTARAQVSAFASANRSMSTLAKGTEGLVEGLDRGKAAFEKVSGALGFWGVAISGAVTLGGLLIDALGGITTEADRQAVAFQALVNEARAYSGALAEVEAAAKSATIAANKTVTEVARLNVELAKKTGDKQGIALAEQALALEEAADRRLEAGNQFVAAQAELAKAEADYQGTVETLTRIDEEIAKRDDIIADRRRRRLEDTTDIVKAEKQVLSLEREDLEAAERAARRRMEAMTDRVVGLEALLERLGVIEDTPAAPTAPTPPRPRGGGAPRERDSRAAREIQANRERIESQQKLMRQSQEYTRQIEENSRLREERLKAEREEAERFAQSMREFDEAREKYARFDIADPVIDFANVLSTNLSPALSQVEQAMGRVLELFTMFKDGQASLTTAIEGSAQAIGGMVAEYIGGVKGRAAWDAAYHLYKGFGTMFTNPAESAGHFIAAAGLGAVAAGIIPTGTSGGKKPPASTSRATEQRASTEAPKAVVYNISAGVMDGQSVNRAIRQSERSSRGTGYSRAMGV